MYTEVKSASNMLTAQDRYYTGWEAWLPELWKVMGLPQMPLSQAGGEDFVDVIVISCDIHIYAIYIYMNMYHTCIYTYIHIYIHICITGEWELN